MKKFSKRAVNKMMKMLISSLMSAVLLLSLGLGQVISYAADDLQFFGELIESIQLNIDDGNGGTKVVWFDGTNFYNENPSAITGITYPSEVWTVEKEIEGTCYVVTANVPVGAFDVRAGFYAKSVSRDSLSSAQKAAVDNSDMPQGDIEYLDIGFKDVNGNEVEPILPISLSITMKDKAKEAQDNGDKLLVDVYHIDENDGNKLEKVASIDEKSEVIDESIENVGGISASGYDIVATFEADSFSIFVVNNATAKRKITFSKNATGNLSGKVAGTMQSILVDISDPADAEIEITDGRFDCKYVCTGHKFYGWYTEPVLDSPIDPDKLWNPTAAAPNNRKDISSKDITLYAIWTQHSHGADWTAIDAVLGLEYDAEKDIYTFDPVAHPLTAGKYYLTVDTVFTNDWEVQGATVLCLNGYTLTAYKGPYNATDLAPITVGSGASLELDDCNLSGNGKGKITGGQKGCIAVAGGTFIMDGGVITGNTGDGIKVSNDGTTGTAHIYNGTISSNTGAGISVAGGTVTLYGGAITGNKSHGVYFADGTVEIEGQVQVTGNTNGGSKSNVYLKDGKKLKVVNPLVSGANIGIRMEKPGVFTSDYGYTSGLNKEVDPAKFFSSDDTEYDVGINVDEVKLVAPSHKHDLYGNHHDNDDENTSFRRWVHSDRLPSEGGNYYLDTDVTLTSTWNVSGNVKLCLNGKKIIWNGGDSRMIYVGSGASLSVTDCNGDEHSVTSPIDGESKSVYGGSITGASTKGAIDVNSGTFNLYRGNIAGNKTTEGSETGRGGGAVLVSGGSFNMYGGNLMYNEAAGGDGGAIRVIGGANANINGGYISGNKAVNGGGISVAHAATIAGGTAVYNTADYGGGIDVGVGAIVDIYGSPNISENTAANAGGGIYFQSGATLKIKDNPLILGNAAAGVANNIHLPTDLEGTLYNITISGAITNTSGSPRIGVTKMPMEGTQRTRFTTGYGYSASTVNNEDGTASTQYNLGKLPLNIFSSDVGTYYVDVYTDECEAMLSGDYVVEYDLDGGVWKDTVYSATPTSKFRLVTKSEGNETKTYYVEYISSKVDADKRIATKPKDPEKEDFAFAGWMIVENELATTQEYVYGNVVNKDIKLFALWEPETNEISYSGGLVGYAEKDVTFDNCKVAMGENLESEKISILVKSEGFDGYVGGFVGMIHGSITVRNGCGVSSHLLGTHVGGICGDCDGALRVASNTKIDGYILMSEEVSASVSAEPRLVIPYRTVAGEIVGREKKNYDSLDGATDFLFYDAFRHKNVGDIDCIDQVVRPGRRFYQPKTSSTTEDYLKNIGIVSTTN